MSASKYIDRICCVVMAAALILTVIFMNGGLPGIRAVSSSAGYASRLFDTSCVHTINIVMDDWDSFIESCTDEEYADCTVIIDNEAYRNVAVRAKGNTSLTSVEAYGNNRYSFKIEFDHYDDGGSYYGLDKLCLNNIIQDNTYMKDYLTYQLMRSFGADAPLCSYSYVTVNGEDWGLYLAVEGVEESFLQRSYGSNYGQLYKPDSMDLGGGRGNGRDFAMEDQAGNVSGQTGAEVKEPAAPPDGRPGWDDQSRGKGSSDVSLIYTDDDFDSYSNIFDNAKTDLSDADKTRLIEALKKLNNMQDIENTVDVEEVLRYFVVHNFVLNFDSYTGNLIHNYYLYENDGKLSMIPWDYNLAFGSFNGRSDATSLVNYPVDTPVSGGTIESRPMLAWIFADEKYTRLYHRYFTEFISEYFDSGRVSDMIGSVRDMIAPYVESDPTAFCTYEEFENGVSALKEFCERRAQSVSGQLSGTIPSTADGQAEDPSSLVDGADIAVTDMGSMNKGNMRGGEFSGPNEQPRGQDMGKMGRRPQMTELVNGGDGARWPVGPGDRQAQEPVTGFSAAKILLLGVSCVILAAGIAAALIFSRKKRLRHAAGSHSFGR